MCQGCQTNACWKWPPRCLRLQRYCANSFYCMVRSHDHCQDQSCAAQPSVLEVLGRSRSNSCDESADLAANGAEQCKRLLFGGVAPGTSMKKPSQIQLNGVEWSARFSRAVFQVYRGPLSEPASVHAPWVYDFNKNNIRTK